MRPLYTRRFGILRCQIAILAWADLSLQLAWSTTIRHATRRWRAWTSVAQSGTNKLRAIRVATGLPRNWRGARRIRRLRAAALGRRTNPRWQGSQATGQVLIEPPSTAIV